MTISGNVPQHLVVGARTGFLTAISNPNLPWRRIAGEIDMTTKSQDFVDLGSAPMPVEDKDAGPLQDFIERSVSVRARNWNLTVAISYNAIQDDQTGLLETKVRAAGENFNRHMNKLMFQALNGGDTSTYGLCYDGLNFFSNSHTDKGSGLAVQDNNFALALSLDNFETNLNLARLFMNNQGEYTEHDYDLLVVPPALERTAAQICNNPEGYDTGNREINPYSGRFTYIVSPYMDSTAWVILASSQTAKPLYLAMRQQPFLQDAWFDPNGPDGGTYGFKFYARYNNFYGDWRLAALGNT